MTDSSADRDPLDRLAEEFVARLRRGERPSLDDYAARHPELADQVRELFPALVELEQVKPATGDHTGAFEPTGDPTDPDRVGEFRILRLVGHGVYEAVQELGVLAGVAQAGGYDLATIGARASAFLAARVGRTDGAPGRAG